MGYYAHDCCYEEMTKGKVHEASEVPQHKEPFRNKYEETREYDEGYNQSGFKG